LLRFLTNMLKGCTKRGIWDIHHILPDFIDDVLGGGNIGDMIQTESTLTAAYIAKLYLYPPLEPAPEVNQMLEKIDFKTGNGKLPHRLAFINYVNILKILPNIPGGIFLWIYLYMELKLKFCKLILGDMLNVRMIHSFTQSLLYMIYNLLGNHLDIYRVFSNGCYNPGCPGMRCRYCNKYINNNNWAGFGNRCPNPECGHVINDMSDINPHLYLDWFTGECDMCNTPFDEKRDRILLRDWLVVPSSDRFFKLKMKHCVPNENAGCDNYFGMHNIFCPRTQCGKFWWGRPTKGWRKNPPGGWQNQPPQEDFDIMDKLFPDGIPLVMFNIWRDYFKDVIGRGGIKALVLTLFYSKKINKNSRFIYSILNGFSMIYTLVSPIFLLPLKPLNGGNLTDNEIESLVSDILKRRNNIIDREIATEICLIELIHAYLPLIRAMGFHGINEYAPNQFEQFHTSFRGAKHEIREKIIDCFYYVKIVVFRRNWHVAWHVALLAYLKRHGYNVPYPHAWRVALQGGINVLDMGHLTLPNVRRIRNILQDHFDWYLNHDDVLDWRALLKRWRSALQPGGGIRYINNVLKFYIDYLLRSGIIANFAIPGALFLNCIRNAVMDKKVIFFIHANINNAVINTVWNYDINGYILPPVRNRNEIVKTLNMAIEYGGRFATLFGFPVLNNQVDSITQNRRILEEIYPDEIRKNRANPDPVAEEIARQFHQHQNEILDFGFSEIFDYNKGDFKPIKGTPDEEDKYVHRYLDELYLALPLIPVNQSYNISP